MPHSTDYVRPGPDARPNSPLRTYLPVTAVGVLVGVCVVAASATALQHDNTAYRAPFVRLADTSPEMQTAQGAFYWGIDQKKFDLPEKQCVQFFNDYFVDDVVVDYAGGPCGFLTGIHNGLSSLCAFFKNMDGRSQVTAAPEVTWFQSDNIVLAKVRGPYRTVPANKTGLVDEIVALTMTIPEDGMLYLPKIARMELFVSHAKDFVC